MSISLANKLLGELYSCLKFEFLVGEMPSRSRQFPLQFANLSSGTEINFKLTGKLHWEISPRRLRLHSIRQFFYGFSYFNFAITCWCFTFNLWPSSRQKGFPPISYYPATTSLPPPPLSGARSLRLQAAGELKCFKLCGCVWTESQVNVGCWLPQPACL